MLYIKYKIHYNNIEGMDEKSLKADIYEIVSDKNKNIPDVNKLTTIHHLLLVSDGEIPTAESIKQKDDLNSLLKLSPSERADKIKSLQDNIDKIYPILEKVFPQFDKPFWLKVFTNIIPGANIPYTFNEQIYIILNKPDIQDSEKIKKITDLIYIAPKTPIRTPKFAGKTVTKIAGTARKYLNRIPGLFKRKKRK
jgi:hypothetical protein